MSYFGFRPNRTLGLESYKTLEFKVNFLESDSVAKIALIIAAETKKQVENLPNKKLIIGKYWGFIQKDDSFSKEWIDIVETILFTDETLLNEREEIIDLCPIFA